jgi:galactokinase
MQLNRLAHIVKALFEENFAESPRLYSSPGRINLIGEHTDYNQGFVLPAAVDKAVYLAIAPVSGEMGRWISVDFNESVSVSRSHKEKLQNHWANYLLGVIEQYRLAGFEVPALNIVVAADIPIGAGMSSSAAIECVIAWALNEMLLADYSRKDLAYLTQRAENSFIGLQCGIMDMFASLHGRKDHAIRLDCRSLEFEYYPLDLGEYVFLLLDSNVKHSLASTEYNTRRLECERGVAIVQKEFQEINSLREVSLDQLESADFEADPLAYKRCRFIIEENKRVLKSCTALAEGRLDELGKLINASHDGLQNEYEVSCPELDFLVNSARQSDAVLGSRMMGGGFGGCTINLVEKVAVDEIIRQLIPAYSAFSGIALKHYVVVTGEGTRKLSL